MEKHSHKDIESLVWLITDADAVVVGVGSGLSSAAGFNHYHWAPALETHLGEFKDTTILILLLPDSITATLPWNSNGSTIQNIFTVCGICLQVSYIWLLRLYLSEKIREMTPGVLRLPFWDMTARNSRCFTSV